MSKADWLKFQAKQTLLLSDEELEGVTGGTGGRTPPTMARETVCKRPPPNEL